MLVLFTGVGKVPYGRASSPNRLSSKASKGAKVASRQRLVKYIRKRHTATLSAFKVVSEYLNVKHQILQLMATLGKFIAPRHGMPIVVHSDEAHVAILVHSYETSLSFLECLRYKYYV